MRPLPTLGPESYIAFFVNGECQGIAFQDLYDYLPLRTPPSKAEQKKREEEEKAAALRKQRDAERQAAIEQARLQQQREDEAAERARQRRLVGAAPSAARTPAKEDVWRRGSPAPPTPTRAPAALPSESAPAAGRYRPGAFGGGGGGTVGGGGNRGGWLLLLLEPEAVCEPEGWLVDSFRGLSPLKKEGRGMPERAAAELRVLRMVVVVRVAMSR